jgi:cap2 methyltransferase
MDIESNRHCHQLKNCPKHYDIGIQQMKRILSDNDECRKYYVRKNEEKSVNHWGQRKLLCSEIEFLTKFTEKDVAVNVVYAGAAPGTHIEYLSMMFPMVKFILYDPANFTVKENDKIEIHQEFFTDEVAAKFTNQNVLFICDIRSVDFRKNTEKETETQIQHDMDSQMKWHQIMKPNHSILKFRLSWKPGKTSYLAGDLHLPVWGPQSTTEIRLVAEKNAAIIEYDNTKIEQQMFYFNTSTRVARYQHNIECSVEGIDHCYDCSAEIFILTEYLKKFHPEPAKSSLMNYLPFLPQTPFVDNAKILGMMKKISKSIDRKRVIGSDQPEKEERLKGIEKRQYINGRPAYVVKKF